MKWSGFDFFGSLESVNQLRKLGVNRDLVTIYESVLAAQIIGINNNSQQVSKR